MSSRKRKKNHVHPQGGSGVELNVMPFVDIFSLLCTFLLFSAVFVTIGILQVQIPFLSNAAPEESEKNVKTRELILNVDVAKNSIELTTSYSSSPVNQKKTNYERTVAGLDDFHQDLVDLKNKHEDADKVTLFVDDEVLYDDLVKVLDKIKLRFPDDAGYVDGDESDRKDRSSLFPKVVMGNIIL